MDQRNRRRVIAVTLRNKVTREERDELLRQIRESLRTDVHEFPDNSIAAKKARRAKAADFHWFRENYLPHYPWDEDCELHEDIVRQFFVSGRHLAAIAAPREHGKTVELRVLTLQQIVLAAKYFILIIQDTETLASDWIEFLKLELEANPRIKQDFGDLRTNGHWDAQDLRTTTGIRILGRGRRQQVRGLINGYHRPDLAIVDDLDTPDNSRNPNIMKKTAEWLIRDVFGALSKTENSLLIDVGNIVAPRCSIALLMEHIERTRKVYEDLPEEQRRNTESLYCKIYRAETDDIPLWPAHYTMGDLARLRVSMGSVAYNAEMLNNPIDPDGIFRAEWLKEYDPDELRQYAGPVIIAWDASMGESRKADRQGIVAVMVCTDKNFRVVDVIDRRIPISDAINRLFSLADLHNPVMVCIEDTTFQALIATILDNVSLMTHWRKLPIRRVKHTINKVSRIERLSVLVERGIIRFDFSKGDGEVLRDEFLEFPKAFVHDDGIDALEMAISQSKRLGMAKIPAFGGIRRLIDAVRRPVSVGY